MGTIRVKYKTGITGGWVKLYLNGEKAGDLFRDETLSFNMASGTCILQIRQFLIQSAIKKITLEDENDQVLVVVKDSLYYNLVNFISGILFLIHFLIADPLGFRYLLYLAIPLGILSVYNLIFERDKFYQIDIN